MPLITCMFIAIYFFVLKVFQPIGLVQDFPSMSMPKLGALAPLSHARFHPCLSYLGDDMWHFGLGASVVLLLIKNIALLP